MADKSESEEPIVSENTCSVCKQDYSQEKYPKLLPCLHTVCEPCVSQLILGLKEEDKIVNKVLKAGAAPHIFLWKRPHPSQSSRRERALKRQKLQKMDRNSMSSVCENVGNEVEISTTPVQQDCNSAGEKAKCPECSIMFDNNEVIKNLYKMEFLNQSSKGDTEASKEEKSHRCTACEEGQDATSFCTECMEWLCEQCVQAHRRVRVTKDHLIQAKEKVQEQANQSAAVPVKERCMPCSLHPHEPLKLYCETCDKLTCRDCQLLEHKEHKYKFVHEAASLFKRQLLHFVEKLKEKQKRIENAKELNIKRQEEIVSQEKALEEEIRKTVEKLIEEFNKRAQTILTDLSQVCKAKKSQLVQKNIEVSDLASQLDHCMKFVESLAENASNASILHTKPMIIKRIKAVSLTRCEIPNPDHPVDIKYTHDSGILMKNVYHLGFLLVDGVPFRPAVKLTQPVTSQSDMNHSQANVRNYIQELQKLPADTRSQVFLRMMQMQKRQAGHQGGSPGLPQASNPVQNSQMSGLQAPPNRVVSNHFPGNSLPNRHHSPSYPSRFPSVQNMNNGPNHHSPPSYSGPPGGTEYGSNNKMSNQSPLISLFQLQNQRGQSQHPAHMPQVRPMPPLTLRPTNNGMTPSGHVTSTPQHPGHPQNHASRPHQPQQQQKNWRWSYVHMPNMTSPPIYSGPPGMEQRPGSTNSVPEICRTSPANNTQRSASADSVKVKQEKGADTEGCSGFSSCSYNNKQNSVENPNHDKRNVQPSAQHRGTNNNNTGFLAESQLSDDNLEAALRSLSEDGLSLGMEGQMGGSRRSPHHLPAPNKHMDSPDPSEDYCACCHNGGELLCCDYCPKVFHFQCHIPIVTVAPSGSWKCTLSLPDEDICIGKEESREILFGGQKRKSPVGLTDKELKACERILLELFSHEASTPFHEPVSKSVPNYYKIITNPMDFTNIKCKLSRQHFNHYSTVREFLTDVKLVFTNCAMYNSEASEVGHAGKNVFRHFQQLVEKFLPYYTPFVKEDHTNFPSPPPQAAVTPPPNNNPVTLTAQTESEHAKGAKRRKMDKQNLIHYH